MRCALALIATLLVFAPAAFADDVESLKQKNAELEKRVQNLEASALEESVDDYLKRTDAHYAAGGLEDVPDITPGALAIRFSGEIRIREEIRLNNYTPKDPDGELRFDFAHMRTRFRVDVDVEDKLGLVIEFQDVRNLGGTGSTVAVNGISNTQGGFTIKRAYMLFKEVADKPITIELGRLVLFYGDQRHIGHLEWVDQGRSYDGGRIMYHPEKWWLDFFAVRVRETVTTDDDQNLVGLYGGTDWIEGYALWLGDNMTMTGEIGPGHTGFVTIGIRAHGKPGNFYWTAEASYQTGEVKADDLSAVAAAVTGGYQWVDAKWKPKLGIEVAFATGDKDPTDGNVEQHQTLFPTNHLYYGLMDLVGWSNILDFRVVFHLHPTPKTKIFIEYHHFQRPEEQGDWINAGGGIVRNGAPGTSSHLGDEIDIVLQIKSSKALSFLIGYTVFLPGDFVSQTGDDPVAHFIFFEARVRF